MDVPGSHGPLVVTVTVVVTLGAMVKLEGVTVTPERFAMLMVWVELVRFWNCQVMVVPAGISTVELLVSVIVSD